MFSHTARQRYIERGGGLAALIGFFADSTVQSLADARARADIVRAFFSAAAVVSAGALVALLPVYTGFLAHRYITLIVATVLGSALLTAWSLLASHLFLDLDGRPLRTPGIPNFLTLVRLCLIAPTVVLLAQRHYLPALIVYAVLGVTDVADGIVARVIGPRSRWGVVMDPLADVLSTAAVFFSLWGLGLVPLWLIALLALRYLMLLVGSLALFLRVGPYKIRATIPGKIVGVVQAVGAGALVAAAATRPDALSDLGRVLYPFLGLGFASIVVSQAVIGLRWLRTSRSLER